MSSDDRHLKGSSTPSRSADQRHEERPIEQEPPPAFSERHGEVNFSQDGFGTKARVASRRPYMPYAAVIDNLQMMAALTSKSTNNHENSLTCSSQPCAVNFICSKILSRQPQSPSRHDRSLMVFHTSPRPHHSMSLFTLLGPGGMCSLLFHWERFLKSGIHIGFV